MTHEWYDVIAAVDERPGSHRAELVDLAIRRAHGLGARTRWDNVLDAVIASRTPVRELCDAYLLHFCALGGVRPTEVA